VGVASEGVVRRTQAWETTVSPQVWLRVGVVAALFFVVYWNPIRHFLVGRWIADGNWSHGWLIPLFSLYFLSTRRDELLGCEVKPSYWGAIVLALSLGAYFWSAWWARMAYPQSVSMIGAIFGATLLMGGWAIVRLAWFPILFLLFAIPLPQSVYFTLTRPLREMASTLAAAVMPLFVSGLHTVAQGVVIDYLRPGASPGQLNVEEACSGMRLMMAFVTLGVGMAYLGNRPFWQRLVMVIACLPIAIFCNTIRVTATGLLTITGHSEYAQGTPHQLLGIAMLLIALGCYSTIGYVLSHLFIDAPPENQTAPTSPGHMP
jgi:exosortase